MTPDEKLVLDLGNARKLKQHARYGEAFMMYEKIIKTLREKPVDDKEPEECHEGLS